MSQPLKVIALISGGKDSLFSLLHCIRHEHQIVALANLYPPLPDRTAANNGRDAEGEDLDSFMYQTVGHSIIPLFAEALDLPLYRQAISGGAANSSKNYAPRHAENREEHGNNIGDETEDLVPLLQRVKIAHPEANAVSTGAILSNYQRTRVESVAIRLGLIPLALLWQYPFLPPYEPSSLLHDMASVGMDARIIKVASGGLDDSFLWENVAEQRTMRRMEKAMARFGGDVGSTLGEGGEFETLAIDGPRELFKKRIVTGTEGSTAGEGGSAVVKFDGRGAVEGKDSTDQSQPLQHLRVPDLLDAEFQRVLLRLKEMEHSSIDSNEAAEQRSGSSIQEPPLGTYTHQVTLMPDNYTLIMSNFTYQSMGDDTIHLGLSSVEDQMAWTTAKIHALLSTYEVTTRSIISSLLLLRNMSDFTKVNPLYGFYFTNQASPPARVTVACGDSMPEGVDVMLSVVADLRIERHGMEKNGLHVQSRSYWAPANIGPYSQAIGKPLPFKTAEGELGQTDEVEVEQGSSSSGPPQMVYIAGQIPLVPHTMALYTSPFEADSFKTSTVLALHHLFRIGRAMNVSWFPYGICYLAPSSSSSSDTLSAQHRADIALEAWHTIHHQEWQRQCLGGPNEGEDDEDADVDVWDIKNNVPGLGVSSSSSTDVRSNLPNLNKLVVKPGMNPTPCPPVFAVEVSSLPMGAPLEWSSVGISSADFELTFTDYPGAISADHCTVKGTDTVITAFAMDDLAALKVVEGDKEGQCILYTTIALKPVYMPMAPVIVIPCRRVWDGEGRQVKAAAVLTRYGKGG